MNDPLRVAVVGATGYAGFELARLLLRHPKIEKPVFYLREGHAKVRCLTELYPQLRGWGEAPCKPLSLEAIASSGALHSMRALSSGPEAGSIGAGPPRGEATVGVTPTSHRAT